LVFILAKRFISETEIALIGERLAQARKQSGYRSQNDAVSAICAKYGDGATNQQDLSRYEKGKVRPPVDMLVALSNTYGVSADWLLTGQTPQTNGQDALPLQSDSGKDWISMPQHDPRPLSQPDRAALEDALLVLRSPDIEGGYSESLYNTINSFAHSIRRERLPQKGTPQKRGRKKRAKEVG
jgi:transcriptional regulator with XRE-family HTH domain